MKNALGSASRILSRKLSNLQLVDLLLNLYAILLGVAFSASNSLVQNSFSVPEEHAKHDRPVRLARFLPARAFSIPKGV